jgi:Zn-dependent alcohol dehydrogenase
MITIATKDGTQTRDGKQTSHKAVEVSAPGTLRVVERPVPEPGASQVRIRIEACGICHTDATRPRPTVV